VLKREFVYDSAFFLNRAPGCSPFVNSTPERSIADRSKVPLGHLENQQPMLTTDHRFPLC
jgi:hypothetical protein